MSPIMWLVPSVHLLKFVPLCVKGTMTGFHLEESVTRQSEPTMGQKSITAVTQLTLPSRHPRGSRCSLYTGGSVLPHRDLLSEAFSSHRSWLGLYRTSLKGQEAHLLKRPQLMSIESWWISNQSTSLSGGTTLKLIIDGFPEALQWGQASVSHMAM